ncbi:hypothetical protein [Streptomyces natalensis]|uniref:Cytochrome C oxidase subunit I n=1 Tax=Streptomyces natalensis ATCC 27448 TaxID=1240678 RepID=A0A0D7CRR8_9ACTN|nr:hypothetical protein [Streptomyces natalensis]KIZ18555.1 hypothetical protein SNA_08115 [Streptomyces natalensis ATCC 27448]
MNDVEAALNEIEGYLLWEAEKGLARTRAGAFCAGLPWLTDTQREDVEFRYCQDQREITRACLHRIAARSASLRAEYEGAYRALRRRLLAAYLGATVAATALVTTAVGLLAH